MKKNGFTTIELITSFTLASVIMIVLFNIILILKDNLSKVNAKTNLLIEKDNLSYNINKRFKEKELSSITTCEEGDKCYLFTYSDDTSDKLIYSNTDKTITFNNYTFDIIEGIAVEEPTITEHYDTMSSTKYNGYFIINVPISLDNKDYSIKINKHFNTDSLVIDIGVYYDANDNRYTRVEYLESTGTQYIDTIVGSTMFKIYIDGNFMNITQTQYIIGAYYWNGNVNSNYRLLGISDEKFLAQIGAGGTEKKVIDADIARHLFALDLYSKTVSIDNMKYDLDYSNKEIQYNLHLFCRIGTNGLSNFAQFRLYSAKIYDNDTLVRDYIPVIDSSERPCLFDKVNRECYYNQGTGEFLWG